MMNTALKQKNVLTEKNLSVSSELVEQAIHDIHSPVAAIQVIVEGLSDVNVFEKRVLNNALNRLTEIVKQLSLSDETNTSYSNDLVSEIQSTDLLNEIQEIVNERKIALSEQKKINIDFLNLVIHPFKVNLPKVDLLRSLTNLINNSVSACKENGEVFVIAEVKEGEFVLRIRDNGKGMSSEIVEKIGERGATFNKKNGSGLGVFYAKKMLETVNGKMNIYSLENQGSEISLKFSINLMEEDSFYQYVLIDNDELVRLTWETKAKMAGVSLLSLNSPELLNQFLDKISKTQTKIYIDSELDNFVRGEFVAKSLYEKGYQHLFMATGHESSRFKNYQFLKCVGKKPVF